MPVNQKDIEQKHIQCLKKIYPEFPDGIEDYDVEKPDCLITTDTQTIGIEHTCLFRLSESSKHPSPKQIDSERDIIVNQAKEIYQAQNHPPVDVAFSFSPHYQLKNRVRFINKLAELIPKLLPISNTSKTYNSTGLDDSQIPNEISFIRIARYDGILENHWATLGADYIPKVDEERIITEIGNKEAKLAIYRQQANAVWLLIVIEGFEISSTLDVEGNMASIPFKTDFDKVIILRYFEKKFIELKTCKQTE